MPLCLVAFALVIEFVQFLFFLSYSALAALIFFLAYFRLPVPLLRNQWNHTRYYSIQRFCRLLVNIQPALTLRIPSCADMCLYGSVTSRAHPHVRMLFFYFPSFQAYEYHGVLPFVCQAPVHDTRPKKIAVIVLPR